MLAITTAEALFVAEPHSFKRGIIPSPISLPFKPTQCSWSLDGSSIYLSSAEGIHRYDRLAGITHQILHFDEPNETPQVLVKDGSSIIASDGHKVLVVDGKGEIIQTFDTHSTPVLSLSLSSNGSNLASTTHKAVHVYNLLSGSHTVLRGLALAGQSIGACAFHPHSPTRLLLGIGRQLVIYDSSRTSGPLKTIALDNTSTGDINAISSSPFSKSLVAVSTSQGYVGLIDLEKEKGLFRTLNMKIALTCISFSPEGASVYMGTCDGKVFIVDLRTLEKPPKGLCISSVETSIQSVVVQGKTRNVESKKPATPGSSKPVSSAKRPVISGKSPAKPAPTKPERSSTRATRGGKSSPNDSNDSQVSVQLDDFRTFKSGARSKDSCSPANLSPRSTRITSPLAKASPKVLKRAATSARSSQVAPPAKPAKDVPVPRKPRTLPTNLRAQPSSGSIATSSSQLSVPSESASRPTSRQRAVSSASRTGSEAVSTSSASSKLFSAASRTSSTSSRPASSLSRRPSSPAPSVPQARKVSTASSRMTNRTPSPDLPGIVPDPATPVPATKRTAFSNLGLGTPEVNRWVAAGNGDPVKNDKGKGKAVEFKATNVADDEDGSDKENDKEHSLIISPLRPSVMQNEWSAVPSPTRYPMPASPNLPSAGPAHELLRTIVKDVMYDFQQETRGEMMGLHLDLVRMGRSWKKELRELMDEYVGDLKDLREENQRLKEENERLRRGY